MKNFLKMWFFIIALYAMLVAIFIGIGYFIAGESGAIIGLICLIGILIYSWIDSSTENKRKNEVIHTSDCDWYDINIVKMDSPLAQKVFDWYKNIMLIEKKTFSEVLRDVNLRREWNKIRQIEDSLPDDDDMNFINALGLEFSMSNANICGTPDEFILNPREECYFYTKSSALKTIQRLSTTVNYSGLRASNGCLKMGSLTYRQNHVEGLRLYDNGHLIVTNQRILFKGENHVKAIHLGSIIGIENFEENGVMLFLSDRTTPIVITFPANAKFSHNKKLDLVLFNNDLNHFYVSIEKMFYMRLVPKDIQDARKEADEVNFIIARKTMVAEGLEKEEKENVA